jgi:glyoxylase-like metal-dependent hydrolase (beta-lactamase superfamily II)
MPRTLLLSLLLVPLLVVGRLAGAEPIDLVRQAVQAQGGADALKALQRLVITGEASFWEPDESRIPFGPSQTGADGTLIRSWDLQHGMAKSDWVRDAARYPNANSKYGEIVTPRTGYVSLPQSARPMSSIRIAASQRELERASPILLLKALESPQSVATVAEQRLGGARYPAVSFRDGRWRFILLFDAKSHLPVAIRTQDEDALRGDSVFDLLLADWQPVAGALVAHRLFYRLNDLPIEQLTYREIKPNPELGADLFAVPAAIQASVKPPGREPVPYQWVIRRVNAGFFNDSDAVSYDPAVSSGLKLNELAPNIQHLVGGTHNMLIVALKDYLVVVDAPINEDQALFAIKAAKQRYPGKPIKYLVLTHHHMDHTNGVRAFMADGATVVIGAPGKSFFEMVERASHRLSPDQLAKSAKKPPVIEVKERMELSDGSEAVHLYRIDNPHAEGMLIVHVASKNLVYDTDLYSPGRDSVKNPNLLALDGQLKKLGLQPALLAGGHGGSGSWQQFQQVVSQ